MSVLDPFQFTNPWCPFEGNGYTLNSQEFRAYYNMTVDQYILKCEKLGVKPNRADDSYQEMDISTDNPDNLTNNEVADNLADILPRVMTVTFTKTGFRVNGSYDDWREVLRMLSK